MTDDQRTIFTTLEVISIFFNDKKIKERRLFWRNRIFRRCSEDCYHSYYRFCEHDGAFQERFLAINCSKR